MALDLPAQRLRVDFGGANFLASRFPATIVIPLLNQVDAWLEQCVRSALAQTVRCEVIVVWSPTTSRSNRDILAALGNEFDNLRLVERKGPGFPATINTGFQLASADRIGLLLSDDWLEPRAVEACLAHDADIVSTSNRVFAADGKSVLEEVTRIRRMQDFFRFEALERKAAYLSHFFLFRKSKLLEIGGADETLGDFPGIDDYDMIWVLLERGATVAIVEEQLYNYRDHFGDRLTLRPPEQALATLEKILAKHGIAEPDREKIIPLHREWYGRPMHVVAEERRRRENVPDPRSPTRST